MPDLWDKKPPGSTQRLDTLDEVQQAERTLTRLNRIPDYAPRITNGEDGKTLWSR